MSRSAGGAICFAATPARTTAPATVNSIPPISFLPTTLGCGVMIRKLEKKFIVTPPATLDAPENVRKVRVVSMRLREAPAANLRERVLRLFRLSEAPFEATVTYEVEG